MKLFTLEVSEHREFGYLLDGTKARLLSSIIYTFILHLLDFSVTPQKLYFDQRTIMKLFTLEVSEHREFGYLLDGTKAGLLSSKSTL